MKSADINEIMRLLPHRYPFLLVDRVLECEPGQRILAIKNVSMNEPFFMGHFPQRPVMPGVLIVEALAQAACLLGIWSAEGGMEAGTLYYFLGIDKARFKRPVEPGDQLRLQVRLVTSKRGIWKFAAEAHVGHELACEAEIMATARKPAAQGGQP
ncbi:MAG TPA: 3-hydroxyacyl-ACP dehydratase FabZ [Nevskiales bacterium]|nr:3-hydroxyacyl-ACP dehydratase FabZ [Nevskiales bacterium]